MAAEKDLLATPESRFTAIITLASSIDGVDLVVGVHEGIVYSVEAPNPNMRAYTEELASLSTRFAEINAGRALAGRPSIVMAGYRDKALLVANIGDSYRVAILGNPIAISSLLAPIRRIVEAKPLTCPECGALLEVFTQTCPRCGRRIPLGVASCPFCGADLSVKKCPNCGKTLRLVEDRIEAVEETGGMPAAKKETGLETAKAAPASEEKTTARISLGTSIGAATLGAIAYFLLATIFKLPLGEAAVAGALPIAVSYALALARGK